MKVLENCRQIRRELLANGIHRQWYTVMVSRPNKRPFRFGPLDRKSAWRLWQNAVLAGRKLARIYDGETCVQNFDATLPDANVIVDTLRLAGEGVQS